MLVTLENATAPDVYYQPKNKINTLTATAFITTIITNYLVTTTPISDGDGNVTTTTNDYVSNNISGNRNRK